MDIKEYIDKKGITCKVSQVADNPAMRPANSASAQEKQWYREASHYKVTLKRPDGRRMKVPFSCGSACGKPDAATVLDCLCSDATFPDTFEDFCSEFGYQSFPSLDLIRQYAPRDQFNVTAPIMEWHQRHPRRWKGTGGTSRSCLL